jgi:pimeloyl-ACP methyl ester carboxylesterase
MSQVASTQTLSPLPLPKGIRSGFVEPPASELSIHVLEAGNRGKPLILLLHGFPEIAFSFRKILEPLAEAGYYVVAPDARGCGRTMGWDNRPYDQIDLSTFSMTNLVRDVMLLVYELGYSKVHCVLGHDYGARTAAIAALSRPDIFQCVVLVSYPYGGPPKIKIGNRKLPDTPSARTDDAEPPDPVLAPLASLPEPRKPYKWYYASPEAPADLLKPISGLKEFLRGYFYLKSANWPGNHVHPLKEWSAEELAKMPYYYTMPLDCGMRDAVRRELQRSGCSPESSTAWLSDVDLDAYVGEFARTGFQGSLSWYRIATSSRLQRDLALFADKRLEPPFLNVLGKSDWGAYQIPGALESMPKTCDRFRGTRWVEQAGHFPHQEQPQEVVDAVLELCKE